MAGDIGDKEAGLMIADHEEVIEVTGHGSHRKIACRDLETSHSRKRRGQDRKLDFFGDFELSADEDQLLLIAEGATPCDDAEAGKQDDEAERLNVVEVVAENTCQVVVKGAGNKEEQAAAYKREV